MRVKILNVTMSLAALNALHLDYHDPDGEFTNEKGVLGSLIDDISSAFSDEN